MARVKKKAHEKLSKANINHVISLLHPSQDSCEKPITKKEACSILNIAYNTTRLQKIIDQHLETEKLIETRKAQNRGKKARPEEIREAITEYLEGESVSEIAKGLFRSPGFVKGIVERIGVPQRAPNAAERGSRCTLPDECIAEEFRPRQIVWSAKYHAPALVDVEVEGYEDKYDSKCYRIYVIERVDSEGSYFEFIERGGFYAYALAYDLGNLEHLTQYGVDLNKI